MDKLYKFVDKLYKKHGIVITWKDYVGVTDRYTILFFKRDDIKLPTQDAKNYDNIMKDIEKYNLELETPTIKELKANIKETVGRKRALPLKYSFGIGKPTVNPFFLVDILECLGECECYYKDNTHPLFFKGNDMYALLCPINIKGDNTRDRGCWLTEMEKSIYLEV